MGFFPGLSGLMIKKAISGFSKITEVNVGLLQNPNAKVGVSGIIDMLKIISQDIYFSNGDQKHKIAGFTNKRNMIFSEPFNQKTVRLIEHTEKIIISKMYQIENINYWTAWNNNIFNKLISLLKRLGVIEWITQSKNSQFISKFVKHNPNQSEDVSLSVEVTGILNNQKHIKTLTLSTFSDYHTTAMFTAALAKISTQREFTGVVFPFEITDLDEILFQMDCKKVILKELSGTPIHEC